MQVVAFVACRSRRHLSLFSVTFGCPSDVTVGVCAGCIRNTGISAVTAKLTAIIPHHLVACHFVCCSRMDSSFKGEADVRTDERLVLDEFSLLLDEVS